MNFNFDSLKEKVFIIAELSANHGGNINIAKETIKAAKDAGADAIKLQTYTADTMTIDCDNEYFQIKQGTIWDGITLYKLYQEAYTPWEWHKELFDYAKEVGIIIFSTPFDKTAVDLLEELETEIYKIASFELTDIPLIEYIASKGKPIIMSTGIAKLEEIEEAVETCRKYGNNKLVVLKCTSAYPAMIEDANLNTIPDMKKRFNTEVGLSDHTIGSISPTIAIALGARVIEKHFIIDKSIGGPDASFSMIPSEFKEMVKNIRDAEKALGIIDYTLSENKKKSREFSRSLFIVEDINEGEILTEKNIRSIRPGFGLAPKYYKEILGKIATKKIKRGTPLSWELIK